ASQSAVVGSSADVRPSRALLIRTGSVQDRESAVRGARDRGLQDPPHSAGPGQPPLPGPVPRLPTERPARSSPAGPRRSPAGDSAPSVGLVGWAFSRVATDQAPVSVEVLDSLVEQLREG